MGKRGGKGGGSVSDHPRADVAERVGKLAAVGLPQEQIADLEGISERTVRRHYGKEFRVGFITANANIGKSIYEQAVGRPAEYDQRGKLIRAELLPDKSASIFLSKVRLGMRETRAIELGGPNGGPIQIGQMDFAGLTTEEVRLVTALLKKAKVRAAGGNADSDG